MPAGQMRSQFRAKHRSIRTRNEYTVTLPQKLVNILLPNIHHPLLQKISRLLILQYIFYIQQSYYGLTCLFHVTKSLISKEEGLNNN